MISPNREGSLWVVSACLAGQACRYDGHAQPMEQVRELVRRGRALPVCPEQMGGLPTPRKPCELVDCGARGYRVLDSKGHDHTRAFRTGAREALEMALLFGAKGAILKTRSPSCGYGSVYDGTFRGILTSGRGVFADLLLGKGFEILTEEDLGGLL
ncbi:2-thiouracil desulfurase family protein [Desulfocurvus sp. DL9XJH121]